MSYSYTHHKKKQQLFKKPLAESELRLFVFSWSPTEHPFQVSGWMALDKRLKGHTYKQQQKIEKKNIKTRENGKKNIQIFHIFHSIFKFMSRRKFLNLMRQKSVLAENDQVMMWNINVKTKNAKVSLEFFLKNTFKIKREKLVSSSSSSSSGENRIKVLYKKKRFSSS